MDDDHGRIYLLRARKKISSMCARLMPTLPSHGYNTYTEKSRLEGSVIGTKRFVGIPACNQMSSEL